MSDSIDQLKDLPKDNFFIIVSGHCALCRGTGEDNAVSKAYKLKLRQEYGRTDLDPDKCINCGGSGYCNSSLLVDSDLLLKINVLPSVVRIEHTAEGHTVFTAGRRDEVGQSTATPGAVSGESGKDDPTSGLIDLDSIKPPA